MTNVSIGGNVTDSVMVFGNNNYVVKIGDVNGGVVNIVNPSDKPKYTARSIPVTVRPRAFPSLLDRENEFEAIKKAVQFSVPVSVWGQQGIGKTSFIRHLTHTLDIGGFTSGVVYLNASNLGIEDLLQALFDLFFDSIPTYKPTTGEIRIALQNIKSLIFLDDFQIGREEAASILDAAPGCLFVLSSTERSLWGEGEVVPLQGLPGSEAIKLFEKELSRPLSEQEKGLALKICDTLKGHPLHILQMASLARETGKTLESLLSGMTIAQVNDQTLANMSIVDLGETERQVIALLAAAGGNTVALEHIKTIFKNGDVQKNIQQLMSLGLVQAHSPRFSLTGTLAASIAGTWDLTVWQDTLLRYAIDWLSQQPAGALVEESSGLLMHTLKNAGDRKKWREVIQLGRALEKFMILFKRWQSWSDILNLILTAAKALNDSKTQAWALHQLGSRALYLGYASQAKTFLTQALNIRQAIGDKAGLAITQHNLNTLNGIITPLKGDASGCRRTLTCGFGAAAVVTVLAVIAWIIIAFLQSAGNNDYPTIEPPVIINPTDTSSPVPTSTSTNTPLPVVTRTPHPTLTLTATPTPVLLYDFVENANSANWYEDNNGDGRINLEFFTKPASPSPEYYISNVSDGYGYAGWDYSVPMIEEKIQKQVILAYPYYNRPQVIGDYSPYFDRPYPDAYLEVKVGYKDVPADQPAGVTFRIYLNEILVFEESSTLSENPTIYIPYTTVNIFEGINFFRLEVDAQDGVTTQDYAVWAIVKLWNAKP